MPNTKHLVSVSGVEKKHEIYFQIVFAPGMISDACECALDLQLKIQVCYLLPILLSDLSLTTQLLSHLCPVLTILVRGVPDVLEDMFKITQTMDTVHCNGHLYTETMFVLAGDIITVIMTVLSKNPSAQTTKNRCIFYYYNF